MSRSFITFARGTLPNQQKQIRIHTFKLYIGLLPVGDPWEAQIKGPQFILSPFMFLWVMFLVILNLGKEKEEECKLLYILKKQSLDALAPKLVSKSNNNYL